MEILFVVLEVLLELLLQVLAELPVDWALNRRERNTQQRDTRPHLAVWIVIALVTGVGAGWLSAQLWPSLWPGSANGRLLFLVVSPLLVGALSYFLNRRRAKRGSDWTRPWVHAGCASLFALALAITRTVLH